MKLLCCVVLLFVAVLQATAIDSQEEKQAFPADYWQNDYDNFYDYDDLKNGKSNDSNEKKEDTDKKVEPEIQDFMGNDENDNESFSSEVFDPLGNYQFEDNRSSADNKENEDVDDDIPLEKKSDDISNLNPSNSLLGAQVQPEEGVKEDSKDKDTVSSDEWWDELMNDKDGPLGNFKLDLELSEEMQEAANEEISQNKEDSYVKSVNEGNFDPDLEQNIEDSNKNQQASDELDPKADTNKSNIDDDSGINYDDDTPEKVLDDLSSDLDKLFETLDKLSDNDSDLGEKENLGDNSEEVDDIQDYEDKYNRPYREGYIMSLREDYDNFLNSNLTDVSDKNANKSLDRAESDQDFANDDYAEVENNDLQVETTKNTAKEKIVSPVNNNDKSDVSDQEFSDEIEKMAFDDSRDNELDDENKQHYYGNDGLVDDDMPKNDDAEVFSMTSTKKTSENESVTISDKIENSSIAKDGVGSVGVTTIALETKSAVLIDKAISAEEEVSTVPNRDTDAKVTTQVSENKSTMNVEALNGSEYNDSMSQLASALPRNEGPIRITLSFDKPTVITSPNHPNNYPMNIIMDWIIEGPGMGIEMNMTYCNINGNVGDFLLVRPGAVDADGDDGILFTFVLDDVRRYRFTNVNRMFVRFRTNPTFFTLTGFSFSAKMIWPPVNVENEVIPEPEQIVNPPTETMELSLAGLTLLQFHEIKPDFKKLIADMAQAYITDNNIDPGLNTTLEVTQITRTAICNIRWPNYETCVEIRFGVPLRYAEPDAEPRLNATELNILWSTYIVKEPFSSRLRNLGITEFAIPDDHAIITMWLVIAASVVIATCLLAFALWRFNCFVDYTRMKAFSDSDSIQNEKRNLDLYPTPHQTLPPLYSENDFKWADAKYDDSSRVDMGGFTNKSFIRDDLFDLDSDEDVIVPHDRKTTISPRDVYDV